MAITGDWWLKDWEKAIFGFDAEHPLESYRRLAWRSQSSSKETSSNNLIAGSQAVRA